MSITHTSWRRGSRLLPLLCAALFSGALSLHAATGGTPPPAGLSPSDPPIGGFAIDGDLLANSPTPGEGDWVANPGGAGGSVMDASGVPIDPVTTIHMVDPYNDSSGDMIFGGGHKWFDNPNSWTWANGKSSAKTDINNVLFHIAPDSEGHIWGTVAADRYSTSGDSYIDFEFLQNRLVRNNDEGRTFTSSGPDGGRTVNDLLLSLAFTGGGKVADFFVWSWQPDGSGGYTYVDMTGSIPAGRVLAALNASSIAVPYGAFGGDHYDRYAFAEGSVDLTALLSIFDPCMSLVVETIMIKTKASQSSNASIEDLIDPIQVRLTIGPSAQAGEDQIACDGGDRTTFQLKGMASQGIFPVASTEWSVVDGDALIDDPASLDTAAHVAGDSALLRLTVVQQNGCVSTDDILLTVRELPATDIAGPTLDLCPGSLHAFTAPAGMDAYAWSISGNGAIEGAADGRTVMVRAGQDCAQPFTLELTATKLTCLNRGSLEVMVQDTDAPLLVVPADLIVECDDSTDPGLTGMATATDACDDAPELRFNDELVPGDCAASSLIRRTWTARDACGNEASAVQTIRVVDTTPPLLSRPADIIVECDDSTAPADTGVATALDNCDPSVTITFSDILRPGDCPQSSVIERTWVAVDDCGNRSTGVQTIRVVDTTPPMITCPPDAVAECSGDTQPGATGMATATDTCDPSPVITFTDAVIPGDNSQESTIVRTWKATDACGNVATCQQRIGVVDTTKPTLTIPSNATVECDADSSPAATGMGSASDNCDPAVTVDWSDVIEPGECAGTMIITRTWTATDDSGNATTEVQVITVADTTAPMISCPPDAVVECDEDTSPAATGTATASDNCDPNATLTFKDTLLPGDCPQEKTIVRTWTATDCRGNRSSCEQRILVQDTTAPTLEAPEGLTLECPANTSPNATGWATGSDNCGNASISYRDEVEILCGASRIITRTWTAKDGCGNEASDVQVIRVEDNTPPELSCVVATTYSQGGYGGGGTPAEILMANYHAAFPDGITVGIHDPSNGDQAPNGLYWQPTAAGLDKLRRFISQGGGTSRALEEDAVNASDGEKRGELAAQTLTLTINMRFNELGIIGIGPNNFPDLVYTREGDSLSGRTVREILAAANEALAGLGLPAGHSYSSLNKLADLLNHAFHQGTHSDWAQAYLEVPAVIVQCASDIPAPDPARIVASDACGGKITIVHGGDEILDQSCPGRYTILRTWIAMDECGNAGSCTQRIIVDDTTAPVLTGESERMVAPGTDWDFIEPVALDNCGGAVSLTVVGTVTNALGDNALMATRTWQALDPCGNETHFAQTVTVGATMGLQSSFDGGSDNWMLLNYTDGMTPIHMGAGGQAGGYITSESDETSSTWFWSAPATFLGDRSDYYGGLFSFAMMVSSTSGATQSPVVLLFGDNLILMIHLDGMPGTDWTSFSVVLAESAGWINAYTGQLATQEEIIRVMSSLDNLLIQLDLGDPSATGGLDNVVMAPAADLGALNWILVGENAGNGVIRLTWPSIDTSLRVEESDSLTTPNWRVIEATPAEINGFFRFEYTPDRSPKFFRLHRP